MGNGPRVSVIMAVYNGERHVRKAIDSVLGQTLEDLEFVVVNDGSTDATTEILASYSDTRITLACHERRGQTLSLNRGIEMSRAPYIARQDADDISLPTRLEKQVAFLDRHEDIGVLGTGVTVIDETGRRLRDYIYPTDHQQLAARLTGWENPIPHSTWMFRAEVVRGLGGYEPAFRKSQDFDLLLRAIERHRIASLGEPLCELRLSMDSATFEGDDGEQLRWALLAYLRTKVRREEGEDLLRAAAWPQILAEYEAWFASSPYQRFFGAERKRRQARIASGTGRYLEGLLALGSAMLDDPRWLMRKVGLIAHETLARDGVRWLTENRARWRSHVRDSGHPRD